MRNDAWPRMKPSVKVKLGEKISDIAVRAGKSGKEDVARISWFVCLH